MSSCRVLVVEDEAIVAMDIEDRLASMGYQLAGHARSGEEALRLAQERPPDLTLMDIRLQGAMDGIAAAQELRRRFHTPVIFLTAYSEDGTLDRAKLAEPYGYILKPFDDRELKSAIEIALYKHGAEEEIRRLNRLYDVLSQVNQAIVRIRSRDELLPAVCRLIVERGGIDVAWIGWLDEATSRLEPVAHFGEGDGFLTEAAFYADDRPEGQGTPGRAVREARSFVCHRCGAGDCSYPSWQAPGRFGFQSCASFPLRLEGRVCGALSLCVAESGFFRDREIELLEEVALDLSFALDKFEGDLKREQAEASLRESEARHRRLFEEATEGIVLADADTGAILECNKAFLQLSGYGREELIGKHQRTLHPKEDGGSPFSRGFRQRIEDRDGAVLPATLITREGTAKQVEIKGDVLEIEGRRVVQGFFRDVTAELRHRHERETTLRLLRLLNEPGDVHDLIRSLTEFFHEWTGCEAVGVRLREGDDFPYFETRGFPAEFVRAEDSLCAKDASRQVVRDQAGAPVLDCMCGNILCGRFDASQPFFTAKGSFWTNCTTELLANTTDADRQTETRNRCNGEGYESVALFALRHGQHTLGLLQVNDRRPGRFTPELITFLENLADQIALALAQRQAQAALQLSEQRFRDVSQAAGEFLWEIDADGRFTYASERVEAILGYRPEELLGRGPWEFMAKGDAERRNKAFLSRHAQGGKGFRELEHCIIAKSGNLVWLSDTAVPMTDAAGRLKGFRGVTQDVTERRRAEEEREKLEARLAQAQKMESVGRLAGGVAHDFNNMLSVILGYADMVRMRLSPEDPLRSDVEGILNAATRSAELTRQLLAFARRQPVSPKVMDLNHGISETLKMLQRLVGEEIQVVWQPGHDLWRIRVDPSQIDQILANLAANARDAIPGVGAITLKTCNVSLDDSSLPLAEDFVAGDYVCLTVSDTGSGMEKELLSHLFEPFFTTKEVGKGTGLGLATVYGIVKQNNGFITVSSEPGKGSTFTILFPRHDDEVAKTSPGEAPSHAQGGTETILLVEDDEDILRLAKALLENLGYPVLAASTPEQALQLARDHFGEIQLLIADVVMPEMNGRQLAEKLRESRPSLKCLYMSGYTADVIADRGVLGQGVHFVQKPFGLADFARRVRSVLGAS